MKNLFYLLVLSVSFALTSCTSNEQDIMPFSPQFEKREVNDINLPYPYLQSFEEIKDLKLDYYQENDGMVLLVNTGLQKVNHMYAVIEQHDKKMMVFLGNSEDRKYFIRGISAAREFTVKVFGGLKDDTQLVNTIPFKPSSVFNNIAVSGWSVSSKLIKVRSTKFPANLEFLFAELKTKKESLLVFLAKPADENFEIPEYGDLGIGGIELYGSVTRKSSRN